MLRLHGFRMIWLAVAAVSCLPAFARSDALAAQAAEQGTVPQEGFRYFLAVRVEPAEGGLRVEDLLPGGPADLSGLRKGDLLVEIAGAQVSRVDQLVQSVQASEGRPLQLAVIREGERMQISVRAGVLMLPSGELVLPSNLPSPQQEPRDKPDQEPPRPPQSPPQKQAEPDKPEPKKPRVEDSSQNAKLRQELSRLKEHANRLEKEIAALRAELAREKNEAKPTQRKDDRTKPKRKRTDDKKPERKQAVDKKAVDKKAVDKKPGSEKRPDKS